MQHFLSPHLQHSSKQLKRFNSPPGKDLQSTSSPSTYHFLQQPQRATKKNNLKIFSPAQILKLMIHSQIPIQNLKNYWVLPTTDSWKWYQKNKTWHTHTLQVATPSSHHMGISISLSVTSITATPFYQNPSHPYQAHTSTKGSKNSLKHSQLLDTIPSYI